MALVNQYDPYSTQYPSSSTQSISYTKTSPYVNKSPKEYLFSIPPNINQEQAPAKIAKAVFPPNFHYHPTESFKTLKYYQAILNETESITIKPIFSQTHANKIVYHSLHIGKFLTETEWGLPLYQSKPLHSQHVIIPNNHYNYFDYINAWSNIFLHQTEDFSHAWFITFDKSFRLKFPAWFPRWWSSHGPTASLFPEELMQVLSNGFQQKFDRSRFNYKITLLPLFMAKYKVPWIMKWNYEVETGEVYRQKAVKWWDKFNHQKIINLILSEFPVTPVQVQAIPAQPVQQKMALPTVQEQSLSDISSSSSLKSTYKSSKSSSKKKEKSTQLKDLAQQLLAKAAMLHTEDSYSESSDASSQQPVNSQKGQIGRLSGIPRSI
ncbi:unnamed protein product [Malus baccata var. baccata]